MWRYYSDFNDNESFYRQILVKHELRAVDVGEDKRKKFLKNPGAKIMSCNFYDSFFVCDKIENSWNSHFMSMDFLL